MKAEEVERPVSMLEVGEICKEVVRPVRELHRTVNQLCAPARQVQQIVARMQMIQELANIGKVAERLLKSPPEELLKTRGAMLWRRR
jgi:hypothetical protein